MVRVLAFFLLAAAFGPALPAAAAPLAQHLEIVTASGTHSFDIELVRSRPDMERGLMFRRTMPADHGMLFDFGKPQPISMWMRNTYLPLDMLFIAPDGRVTHVAEHAEPLSEAIISSDGPALGVLELNAGVAAKIGVKAGDRVKASIFKN